MIEDRKIIEMNIADTIMERPYGFQVNKRHFLSISNNVRQNVSTLKTY